MKLLPDSTRGRWRTLMLALAVAAVAALGISAAAVAAPSAKQAGDKLVVLEESIAPSLDLDGPNGADPQTQEILDNVMEPLVSFNYKLKNGILESQYNISQTQFAPRLASSYSRKGLVWTFKLNPKAMSCAGNPLTADDVVYTFQRAKSVSGASPVAWFLSNVGGVLGLEVFGKDPKAKELKGEVVKVDDNTVRITQSGPSELWPRVASIFALYIFDSKAMKAAATAKDPWSHGLTLTKDAPGFGAYCLKSWTKGSEMVLQANPGYYRGLPQYKTVTIRKVPAISNRVAAIRAGAADVTYPLTPTVIQDLQKTSNVSVLQWYNNNGLSLGMNYKVEPFGLPGNQYLRQAIAYAIPYQDIITQDYKGNAKQWLGNVNSIYYGYKKQAQYSLNIAKAKELMTKAGYPDGKGLEKYQSAFTLYYTAERSSVLEPIANRLATSLKQIGINIKLAPLSISEMATRELTKFDLPMWLRDQLQPIGTDAGYAFGVFFASKDKGGIVPSTNYDGIDADYLAQQKLTGAARIKVLHRVQDKLMVDLPLIPIVEFTSSFGVRKGITNLEGRPNNSVAFWYLKGA